MSDNARKLLTPKYEMHINKECICLLRDGFLLKMMARTSSFHLLRLSPETPEYTEYQVIKRQAKFAKRVYGIFGYVRLMINSYLIVIEEAALVG